VKLSDRTAPFVSDLRSGLRQLRAAPVLSAVLIATLGFGIGSTIAVFSIVHAVLLAPLPYADQDRVVVVFETLRDIKTGRASVGHFHDWTEQSDVFSATAALQPATYNLADAEQPERVAASRVTPGFFDVLHIPPALGRYFTAEDVSRDDHLVVLSHTLWTRRFASDPTIVGREVRLNDQPYTVLGVAAPGYGIAGGPRSTAAGLSPELWTPLVFTPQQRANYGSHAFLVLGKLKTGATKDGAQQDLQRVTADIRRRYPREMATRSVNVVPLSSMLVGTAATQMYFLLGAVTAVLLIGCVNVASVLLARGAARRREMAIRCAVGSTRAQIARQMISESLVLALVAGMVALGIGAAGTRILVALSPGGLPRVQQAHLSPVVLLFAFGLTIVVGLAFGAIPALRAARSSLRTPLAEGGWHAMVGTAHRTRGSLVVVQLAVTMVLLVAAGLLLRSAYAAEQVPLGFAPDHVLAGRVTLPADRYREPAQIVAAFDQIINGVRGTPDVDTVGAATWIPMGGGVIDAGLAVEGKQFAAGSQPSANIALVTGGYLEAIRVPLRRGRMLRATDMAPSASPVMVINEYLAGQLWPGADPIGKRISTWAAAAGVPEWREVVGVVGDVRTAGLTAPIAGEVFLPYGQAPSGAWDAFQRSMTVVVRAASPLAQAGTLRRSIRAVDPSLAIYNVGTFEDLVALTLQSRRLNALLLSALAIIALSLATLGVYGVLAYFVSERVPEIGLRLAIGATAASVIAMILRRGLTLIVVGLTIGLGIARVASGVLRSVLFGVTATDMTTYAVGASALVIVSIAAVTVPAVRASRIDPVRSLVG
jgi:putative ABC transport system permease protein